MRLAGVLVLEDGRILVADQRNKFVVLREDGSLMEEWKTGLYFLPSRPLVRSGDSSFVVRHRLYGPPGRQEEPPLGYVQVSTIDGRIIDTISVPATPFSEEVRWGLFQPKRLAAFDPRVGVVGAVTSRYLIDIRRDGGRVTRIHYDAEPVPFSRAEREENELIVDWYRGRGWRDPSKQPDPPDDKQVLRGLEVASDGKIWVRVHTTARKVDPPLPARYSVVGPRHWIEPFLADVFSPEGEYLYSVSHPGPLHIRWLGSDTIAVAGEDRVGAPSLDLYVIEGTPIASDDRGPDIR
jgi:hypothetical protein